MTHRPTFRPILLDVETQNSLQNFLEVVISVSPKAVSWARDVGLVKGTFVGILELGHYSFVVLETETRVILTSQVSPFRCLPRYRDFEIVFDDVDQPVHIQPIESA